MPKTTILVESETRQLLRKVGRKEQTYDALIKELVVRQQACVCEATKENPSGSGVERPATRQVLRPNERNNQQEIVPK